MPMSGSERHTGDGWSSPTGSGVIGVIANNDPHHHDPNQRSPPQLSTSPNHEHRISVGSRDAANGKTYETFSSYQRDETDSIRSFLSSNGEAAIAQPSAPAAARASPPRSQSASSSSRNRPPLEHLCEILGLRDGGSSDIQRWLAENGFEKQSQDQLAGYSIHDLLALSKSDAKTLLGVKSGIRLFNRLKFARQEAGTDGPILERGAGRSGTTELKSMVGDEGPDSPTTKSKRFIKNVHPDNLACDVTDCHLLSCTACHRVYSDGSVCAKRLCMVHANKSLITGNTYCDVCNVEQSSFEQLKYSVSTGNACRTQ